MPVPLVSALTYLMAPRALGALADKAMQERQTALLNQAIAEGLSYDDQLKLFESDPYLNALSLVPRQSGAETLIDSARQFYNGNPYGIPREAIESPGLDSGLTVTDLNAGRGFNDPNVQPGAYIVRGGQFLTPMDDFLRYGGRDEDAGGRYLQTHSYGQTDQPATEVRFDQPPGGAYGGLAALIRRGYA